VTAALVYWVDHDSFADASAADLAEIEPSLTWQREASSSTSSEISFSVSENSFVAAAYSSSGVCYSVTSIAPDRVTFGQKTVGRAACEVSLFRPADFSKNRWT
jgi:hypothetical protein